jgi:Family of unknown function (DUF5335)
MPTREIPRDSWTDYFDDFSRRHEGWIATVEVMGDEGAQTEAEALPLAGVSAEKDGRDISIALNADDRIVEHIVNRPEHVRVEEDEGDERAVQIESAGGTTLLTFPGTSEERRLT